MKKRKIKEKKRSRSSSSKGQYTSNCWWSTKATNILVPSVV